LADPRWRGSVRRRPRHRRRLAALATADPYLLPIAAALAALGQLMTSRLEPLLGPRQGTWVLVGLGAMILVGLLPTIGWLRRYRYTWAALAIALQLLTLAF
jgi:cell division protein FtsW (lipid II flippase)